MIDREQIYKWWHLIQNNGEDLCEIRCLDGKKTYSGYYKSVENIIRDIDPLSERPNMQIYFVLNSINADCYDRDQKEHIRELPKNTTSDNDIEGRRFILIDFDPKRPAGVGSTDKQLELAHHVAVDSYRFLLNQGLYEPIVSKSGNGYHILIPVEMDNTQENTKLVERFLKAMAMMFQTPKVDIDLKVFNASRICKLYGTYAKKGSNTPEHPWRLAEIVRHPDTVKPNRREYIEKIAALYPEEKPQPTKENNYGQSQFDLMDFFSRHNIEYRAVKTAGGTRYILKECPFDSGHKDPDSMVFQHDNGALAFCCLHNSCSNYTWRDYRMHYEPDAYDRKEYNEFRSKQRYNEKYTPPAPAPQPVIKEENTDLGKKWLTLRDIKVTKDSDRFCVKTGIYQLDKAIGGLFEGQTTILSGINASGKTAILNQLLLNSVQRNIPSALWSGELTGDRLKQWLCQTAAGKHHVHKLPDRDYAYETDDDVYPYIEEWVDERLVIYNNDYGNKFEQLLHDMEEAIARYKLRYIVLDNLMALSLDELVGSLNEKQKELMMRLDAMAKKFRVHILIIAHPRKEANFQLLRKESISGTSDLTNLCCNLLLIHRVGDDFEKRATEFWGKDRTQRLIVEGYSNIIEVAKNRDYGVNDYTVGLFYEGETRRFKNYVSEEVHYDWEDSYNRRHEPPKQITMAYDTEDDMFNDKDNEDIF